MSLSFKHWLGGMIALLVLFAAGPIFAQSLPVNNGLELTPSIGNPLPNQEIEITARSYSTDINSAEITWKVNGVLLKKAIGLTVIKLNAPESGKKTTIDVSATALDGTVYSGSLTITSGSVDLIVETDGYVPPFYPGKLPIAYQNTMKIVAIPHLANTRGVEYDPKTLIYNWKKNNQVLADQSGYGKQAISLTGDVVPRNFNVSVTVSTRDGGAQTQGITQISFVSPTVNFYVDDPLYGPLWNKAIGGTIRIGQEREVSVLAEPYGFNKPEKTLGNLNLTWSINNLLQNNLANRLSIILRSPAGAVGSSNVNLDIKNSKLILQGARDGFTATFNNSSAEPSPTI